MDKKEFERVVNELLHAHAFCIAEITVAGQVAVVFHDPCGVAPQALRTMGWDGEAAVFALRPVAARRMAKSCAAVGDYVTGRWLERRGTHRVLLVMGAGTLLLNFVEGSGWSTEPGSNSRAMA